VSETTRMVGMGVRQENGGRGDTRKEVQPVGATIDHNPGFPACDDDAAVAPVKPRARSNFSTGAEEGDRHELTGFTKAPA
jgi:hypothetical protein